MDDLQILLDDQLIKCQALRASPYLDAFAESFKVIVYLFIFQGINILSQIDEIQILLDDHILKCVTMRGSIYLKYIEKRFKVTKNDHTSKIDRMMIKMITKF